MNIEPVSPNARKSAAVAMLVGLLIFCGAITWSLSTKIDQTILALILTFVLVQVALVAPVPAIIMAFVFLAIMGDVRRLMVYYIGPVQYDVLLLVAPAVAITLFLTGMLKDRTRVQTKVGWWIFILMLLMGLEIFNPIQGSLAVGFAGGLFYLIPLAWYWIGWAYGTQEFLKTILFRVVVPVAVLAGLFGMYQAYIDFPDYQYQWLLNQSNLAVNVNGRPRPFSFFVSPPEYALYCAIGSAILLSGAALKRYKPTMIFAPFLLLSCFLQGGRETLLANLSAFVAIWGIRVRPGETKLSVRRMVFAGIVVFGSLYGALIWLQGANVDSAINPMVSYQVQGLLNPMESSATGHATLFYTGILSSFVNPAGVGLGATTNAAGKLATRDTIVAGTEFDVSNMFVSLGPVGGLIYLALLFRTVQVLIKYARRSDTVEAMAVFGLFVCGAGHWLNGGHYSIAALIWFCVGVIDKLNREWEESDRDQFHLPVAAMSRQLINARGANWGSV